MIKVLRKNFAWIIAVVMLLGMLSLVSYKYFTQNVLVDYYASDVEPLQYDDNGKAYIEIEIQNKSINEYATKSIHTINSADTTGSNFFISYHVYNSNGEMVENEGIRSDVSLQAGEKKQFKMYIDPSQLTGDSTNIGIDMIKEGEYWFSEQNNAPKIVTVSSVN